MHPMNPMTTNDLAEFTFRELLCASRSLGYGRETDTFKGLGQCRFHYFASPVSGGRHGWGDWADVRSDVLLFSVPASHGLSFSVRGRRAMTGRIQMRLNFEAGTVAKPEGAMQRFCEICAIVRVVAAEIASTAVFLVFPYVAARYEITQLLGRQLTVRPDSPRNRRTRQRNPRGRA